jgi:hypothetical protein
MDFLQRRLQELFLLNSVKQSLPLSAISIYLLRSSYLTMKLILERAQPFNVQSVK